MISRVTDVNLLIRSEIFHLNSHDIGSEIWRQSLNGVLKIQIKSIFH